MNTYTSPIYLSTLRMLTNLSFLSTSLELYDIKLNSSEAQPLVEAIKSSKTLETLELVRLEDSISKDISRSWLDCLRANTSVKNFVLQYKTPGLYSDEDDFKELMEVLQVNLTLSSIHIRGFHGRSNGKMIQIQEALHQNQKQSSFFSVFREAKFDFEKAKAGRIFLCGSPYAGKTQLRDSMMQVLKRRSFAGRVRDKVKAKFRLLRTKGIEVELLMDDEDMKISVWDLAGQWVFRALQDLLFPRTNQASVFVFIFSPYESHKDPVTKKRLRKSDPHASLKQELEKWLRFIVSNSHITRRLLPQVLVVCTHQDKLKKDKYDWDPQPILDEFRIRFQSVLDLCSQSDSKSYMIDATDLTQVERVTTSLQQLIKDMLKRRSLIVPKVCTQLITRLTGAQRYEKVNCSPVWSFSDFQEFCVADPALECISSKDSRRTVIEAVASYMHDVGAIVKIPGKVQGDEDLMVVDPGWLSRDFLGELISMGHNFQVPECENSRNMTDGFVDAYEFDERVKKVLQSQANMEKKIQGEVIEKLMTRLDLCYKLTMEEGGSKFFIPTIIGAEDELESTKSFASYKLGWKSPSDNNYKFFGYRLHCSQKTTLMTSALFPRFQIHFWEKLTGGALGFNVREKMIFCQRGFFQFLHDGYDIIVEDDGGVGDHIDILVKFSTKDERNIARRFVKEKVVHEFQEFAACHRGCPGVTLEVGILATYCVEDLVPRQDRGEGQAVLVETLKEDLARSVKTKLQNGEGAYLPQLFTYQHTWQPGRKDRNVFEFASDLLEESDMETIYSLVAACHLQRSQDVEALKRIYNNMVDGPTGDTDQPSSTNFTSHTSEPTSSDSGSTGSETRIIETIHEAKETILGEMRAGFKIVRDDLRKYSQVFESMQSTCKEVSLKVDAVLSKLEELMAHTYSSEDCRTPRLPYISCKDITPQHKVRSVFNMGTPIRLHFMCESKTQPHSIDGQEGFELIAVEENKNWLRQLSSLSLKMISFLLKAGIQLTLGSAQLVPDLADLATGPGSGLTIASVALEEMKLSPVTLTSGLGDEKMEDMWAYLMSCLPTDLNFANVFELHRVKYKIGNPRKAHAWLCVDCLQRGRRDGILKPV
ncbi:hypothetical protein Mapa_001835 [Marchantia paleacea]|nr:hypothetical protein Mapa_001835 [Marchantia paleacea]